jgi:predicted acyltransferase
MLLNLNPGSWEHNYGWLVHARWEGGTLIDMVAPAFLFCIGAALPLSLQRRHAKGDSKSALLKHVIWRSSILMAIGIGLNLYPYFDFAHFRIPGVLQRIGLCYGLVGALVISTSRLDNAGALTLRPGLLFGVGLFILVSYWMLLFAVPVPGFGAPRFDPVGSWPAVIDRAVIGTDHMFPWWPVDGKVVFDPEGIVSTYPACFNVLLGVLAGWAYAANRFVRPALTAILVGASMIVIAFALHSVCPIIKNLWTSTFAMFSGGFALLLLGLLMPISRRPIFTAILVPARIFGENPLLAYIISWLIGPLLDLPWIGDPEVPISLRNAGQLWFGGLIEARLASFVFAVCCLLVIFMVLLYCHRRRWILKI